MFINVETSSSYVYEEEEGKGSPPLRELNAFGSRLATTVPASSWLGAGHHRVVLCC